MSYGAFWAGIALMCIGQAPPLDEEQLIKLAKDAIVAEVTNRPAAKPSSVSAPKPVFVTIEIGGAVRGCRGELETRAMSLEQEVILAARGACRHDPRYRSLAPKDLKEFKVTVTVVDRTDPIATIDGLLPSDGLVLKKGDRTGIVLPYEGRDPRTRLAWAYRKAGVSFGSSVTLSKLVAVRFRG